MTDAAIVPHNARVIGSQACGLINNVSLYRERAFSREEMQDASSRWLRSWATLGNVTREKVGWYRVGSPAVHDEIFSHPSNEVTTVGCAIDEINTRRLSVHRNVNWSFSAVVRGQMPRYSYSTLAPFSSFFISTECCFRGNPLEKVSRTYRTPFLNGILLLGGNRV